MTKRETVSVLLQAFHAVVYTLCCVSLGVFFWTVVGHFPDIFRRDVLDTLAAPSPHVEMARTNETEVCVS